MIWSENITFVGVLCFFVCYSHRQILDLRWNVISGNRVRVDSSQSDCTSFNPSGSRLKMRVPGIPSICISWLTSSSLASGGRPPKVLTLSREARFIIWHLRCPFLGNANEAQDIFGLVPGTHKKKPCAVLARSTNTS